MQAPFWGEFSSFDLARRRGVLVFGLLVVACGGETTRESNMENDESDASAAGADGGISGTGNSSSTSTKPSSTDTQDAGNPTSTSTPLTSTATTSGDATVSLTEALSTSGAVSSSGETSSSNGVHGTNSTPTNAETNAEASTDSIQWVPLDSAPHGLTDCREQRIFGADSCAYQLNCEGNNLTSNCNRGPNHEWECTCTDADSNKWARYTLLNVETSDAACTVGIPYCVPGHEPELQVECSLVEQELSVDVCSLDHLCIGEGELADGVKTRQSKIEVTRTCTEGLSSFECSCENDDVLGIVAADPNDACTALHAVCTDEVELVGEPYCQDPLSSLEVDGCRLDWLCGSRTEIDANTYVISASEAHAIWCYAGESGSAYVCYGTEEGAQVAYPTAESPEAACETMSVVNRTHPPLEPKGTVDCTIEYTTIEPARSFYQAWCSQDAALGDLGTFTFSNYMTVDCYAEEDAWLCNCYSNQSLIEFDVTGVDSEASLELAYETCKSRAFVSERERQIGFGFD